MMARKITLTLVALILFIPVFTYAADEPSGKPFQALQQQIDQLKIQLQNIQLTPGPKGDKVIKEKAIRDQRGILPS